jgi:hypothetical protein
VQTVYRTSNPEKVKDTARRCAKKRANKRRESAKAKRHSDPMVAFIHKVRGNVSNAFKRKGWGKTTKTQQILGCDYNTLHNYLVLSAIRNYGEYVEGYSYAIDHIIPLATASTEEDVIRLNHYTNLQFLTPKDNRAKWDKLDFKLK